MGTFRIGRHVVKAQYICFEGIDGAGKSSQIELLAKQFDAEGVTPIVLSEPSYGVHGREARKRMAEGTLGNLEQQRGIFTLDRIDHVKRKIIPALDLVRRYPDFVILQSRSYFSSPAYQFEGMDPDRLKAAAAAEGRISPAPDLVIILDISADEAIRRLQASRRLDSFEARDRLEIVGQRYRYLARFSSQCVLIDGTGDLTAVNGRVRNVIATWKGG